jgi:uncharacterized membrane protein
MKTATQQFSRHVSVPSNQGVRVEKAITIARPVQEVYGFWRRLDNLPRFMRHVESITVQDELHSHWAVKAPSGKVVEWDAEIIEQRENEMISWRSAPGADVDNAGSVWFTPLPGGEGTLVRVEIKYIPPVGKTGALVAKAFGRDAESEIEQDLHRLKAFLETGQLPEETTSHIWQRAAQTARKTALAADTCVHNNTWTAIVTTGACALALGLFVGWRLTSPMRGAGRFRRSRNYRGTRSRIWG